MGRGAGKTRTGSENSLEIARANPGRHWLLVGQTRELCRDDMIEGESGILSVCPPDFYPKYNRSELLLRFPNGFVMKGKSAEQPERIRGKNLIGAWGDEHRFWKDKRAFQNLLACLRKGRPKLLLTSTLSDDDETVEQMEFFQAHPQTHRLILGTTFENYAYLSDDMLDQVAALIGTPDGDRELFSQLPMNRKPRALWTKEIIEKQRISRIPDGIRLLKICISIDPATGDGNPSDGGDEVGMVVGALGSDRNVYILADYSGTMGPAKWIEAVRRAMTEHKGLDTCFYEKNRVGVMIYHALINAGIRFRLIEGVYSGVAKSVRAQPCVPLYIRRRVFHVGKFVQLEHQQTNWQPGDKSPDRMDALVNLLIKLLPPTMQLGATKPAGW